jgi:hypothetical protein
MGKGGWHEMRGGDRPFWVLVLEGWGGAEFHTKGNVGSWEL